MTYTLAAIAVVAAMIWMIVLHLRLRRLYNAVLRLHGHVLSQSNVDETPYTESMFDFMKTEMGLAPYEDPIRRTRAKPRFAVVRPKAWHGR